MNKLETLKDIVADKYDGCYEVMRECVMAYANVDTNLLDCINNSRVLIRGVDDTNWYVDSYYGQENSSC